VASVWRKPQRPVASLCVSDAACRAVRRYWWPGTIPSAVPPWAFANANASERITYRSVVSFVPFPNRYVWLRRERAPTLSDGRKVHPAVISDGRSGRTYVRYVDAALLVKAMPLTPTKANSIVVPPTTLLFRHSREDHLASRANPAMLSGLATCLQQRPSLI